MRLTSVISLTCLCGKDLEVPDTTKTFKCHECGRLIEVAALRNDQQWVVQPKRSSPLPPGQLAGDYPVLAR